MADLRRLPNLSALRAFEAAARHENFSRAAEEIHVTHGAISHQVRALEEELGVPLFLRHGKRLAVTPEGERFAAAVRQALAEIANAADAVKAGSRSRRITITSLPSFAARGLAPRLGRFIEMHPDIEVVLQSNMQMIDFTREDVDVGVRFGNGNYPGLHCEFLMRDYYYPVASPRFDCGRLPATIEELAKAQLVRTTNEPWVPWFAAAGKHDFEEARVRLSFQDSSLPVRAALEGDGIALVRHSLVAQDVEEGKLVRLFDVALECEFQYWFVALPGTMLRPAVKAFRDWLFAEFSGLDVLALRPRARQG